MKTHTNKEEHIKEEIKTQVIFITGHITLLVALSTNTKKLRMTMKQNSKL